MKRVYDFHEGKASMNQLLGGKGANIAEMTNLNLPVPTGFTITTTACMEYLEKAQGLTTELMQEITAAVSRLEDRTNKEFGSSERLLLVSVRSGARVSMPGMMDTILNLGLNDQTVSTFAEKTSLAFAYDCYRRLLQMFANVVYGISEQYFASEIAELEVTYQKELLAFNQEEFNELIARFKKIYSDNGKTFPQDPFEQLTEAVQSVFKSWNNHRAQVYRRLHNIPNDWGTAVNVQQMVFGNSGKNSGTGVAFTRNPATGENEIYGEFLSDAQGEDIVAGIRTPEKISQLQESMPDVYQEFSHLCKRLERHYLDMQDIEFTVEDGKLYLLQTRTGKRTAKATVKIVVDLVAEGMITKEEALKRVEPELLNQLLHPIFSTEALKTVEVLGKGLPASPGAATGKVVFTASRAKELTELGEEVVLVRQETSPEDIEGMVLSQAIVTSRGGLTSHAAVVARGLGTCCVVGCGDLQVDEQAGRLVTKGIELVEGQEISVNGNTGELYLGVVATELMEVDDTFHQLMTWADELSQLKVCANAETAKDLTASLEFGAQGVGLARTEHMFFAAERLLEMRRLILAETPEEKAQALKVLLTYQQQDFYDMFAITKEKPMIIRLLDPPMHEFLPHKQAEIIEVANSLGKTVSQVTEMIAKLHETNPMLGHRGCRLGITAPAIYQMQVEAIMRSAIELKQAGINITPKIMIPLIGGVTELVVAKEIILEKINQIFAELHTEIPYEIGTMIEIPRACLVADQLAEHVDFFSFGTNDLTQLTYGFSRDDVAKFMPEYLEKQILAHDPFQTVDEEGVGELMRIAVEKGRKTKPNLSIGVCGEVGGDPQSIQLFQEIGVDYVSCSPYRIPLARLSVAQAVIK